MSDLAATFAIPLHYLGPPLLPCGRREAASFQIVYEDALRTSSPVGSDAELLRLERQVRTLGEEPPAWMRLPSV